MFSAEQYRSKAAEYRAMLTNIPSSPNEVSEFRNLEQTYTTLAENEEWMALHVDRTIRRGKTRDELPDLDAADQKTLTCVARVAVMRQRIGSAKLQQELVDHANLSILPHTAASTAVATEQMQALFDLPTDENYGFGA